MLSHALLKIYNPNYGSSRAEGHTTARWFTTFTQMISDYIIIDMWSLWNTQIQKQYSSIFCNYLEFPNGAFCAALFTVNNRSSLMQNTPIKSLEMLPKNPKLFIQLFTANYSPPRVVFLFCNRRWAVSAPHFCSAVIIGTEQSIFYLAMQSCDSCVGGQHEGRLCARVQGVCVQTYMFMKYRDKIMDHRITILKLRV